MGDDGRVGAGERWWQRNDLWLVLERRLIRMEQEQGSMRAEIRHLRETLASVTKTTDEKDEVVDELVGRIDSLETDVGELLDKAVSEP